MANTEKPAYDNVASELWDLTKTDWHVTLYHCLTEPVCSYVDLVSDYEELPKLIGFIGVYDANESIRKACEYHIKNLEKFYAENPSKKP